MMKLPKFMVHARAKAAEGRLAHRATIPADVLQRRVIWGAGADGIYSASKSPTTATVYVYEPIGLNMWTGEGCSAKDFVGAIEAAKRAGCTALDVRFHSEGGDLLDGLAMFEALKRCGMSATAFNDGLCASAATIVALGCSKVVAAPASEWMSHRAWAGRSGNASDMEAMRDLLSKLDGTIADIYSAKTGKTPAECLSMMAAGADGQGSWMTADECKAFGFADEIAREQEMAPAASASLGDDMESMSDARMGQGMSLAASAARIIQDERDRAAKAAANAALLAEQAKKIAPKPGAVPRK